MAQQQSGDEEVGKEKPGNGGAGTGREKGYVQWRDVDVLPIGPVNVEVVKRRYGVISKGTSKNFSYFPCRHFSTGYGCEFAMRWAKHGGLLQQHGQHNHALNAPSMKQVDWKDVDIVLPIGPDNVEEIKQRYGVNHLGGHNFDYFQCRRRYAGCKFTLRWAKQGGLLQQRGQHSHAVVTQKQDQKRVKGEEEDGTGTESGGEEEEVRIEKFLQRDYKCLGRMVPEGEEKPSKESMPVHTIQEEDEDMDLEEGTSQATRKKKIYRYTQRQLPGPVKKEEPAAEEAEKEALPAPPPPQMPRIAIVVPQWLLQPHQPVEVAQPAKMLLRERKKHIDYGE